jgi:hypothetical protein
MSDELDRLRAWAAGAHGPSPCWCEGDYDPRPAVLALFDRMQQAEAALHRVARAGLTDEERVVLDAVVPDHPAQADPNT